MRRYRVTRDPWPGLERAISRVYEWGEVALYMIVFWLLLVGALCAGGR